MNLSNEKNTLLNTVSRLAVDLGARASAKFVTRSAMTAAALTVATFSIADTTPAIASCSPATAVADGTSVTCSDAAAGGFDADGYDSNDIRVFEDGVASGTNGIDLGAGTDGNSDDNTVFVFDLFFGGTTVGTVTGTAGDGILITGDKNTVNNGFMQKSDIVGGGKISGTDDGIDIAGTNNTVNNFNNGNGADSGVISGGGGGSDDGVEVSGGTSGNVNTINNGLLGTGTAYIISGGTTGAVTGDDGVDATGWTTVNNGKLGEIHGDDRGIQFHGSPAGTTLTVDNDGKIIGDEDDGIVVQSSGTIVNYSGAGTVSGGRGGSATDGAGIDIGTGADNVQVKVDFDEGGLIEGYTHGMEIGPDGDNNTVVINGKGTVEGDGNSASDGIHIFETGTGNFITIDDGATVQGKDDGVDMGSGNKLLVDGGSSVIGDTDGTGGGDGIQGEDDNEVHVTGASKVVGDPGILMNDGNKITVDGGSDVTGDPEDGINVDDDNTILIGGAGGAGTVYGKGASSDGISLTDGFGGGTGGVDDNSVTIGKDGTVDAQRDGIVVGNVDAGNDDNAILIEDGGNVIAGRDGIVVNGQDDGADDNTVTINDGGEVNAGGDGVRLLGDSIVTNVFDALAGGGPILIGDADGTGNDLVNEGIIRAGGTGVLVSNTNSDVDNSGGEIYAGEDGVRFTTLHTDEADGDGGGVSESGYQSDSDSVIVAGRDGIHYDNYADDAFSDQSTHVSTTFGDVNGLGDVDVDLIIFKITGNFPEVVVNEGVIEAQRHGIRVNDDFDVTNGVDGVIVAGGLPGKGSSGGDGIHADANNDITNNGIIAAGADADGDTNGIEVTGESNTIVNEGIIDTRGDTVIDEIDNATLELGAADAQDNGAGGDGIHATVNGLSLKGFVDGYDQQTIYNGNIIIAADDGIDVKSGGFGPGLEQLITNDDEASITANDDGIVAEHYNIILNEKGGVINADDDNVDGGDGINVGHSNVVTNDGDINAGLTGNGIVMGGQKGPFSFGNEVYNNGNIDAGVDGIQVNGEQNYIENTGNIKGGDNGVALNDEENDFVSTSGDIEGGTGAGIYSDEDNDIELSGTTKVFTTAGLGGDGIFLEDDNSLEIEDGVTVWGDNDGIVLDGDDNDVDYEGDGVNGVAELKGTTGDALQINGDSNTFNSSDSLDLQGGDDGIQIGGNANSVDIDGNVSGEDDGIYLDTATGNVVNVDGDVTGDSDTNGSGDGIDIFGGGSNTVTVGGAISGDPGVVITNSNNNNVSGASISGTNGGVIISNGNSNNVSTTVGAITGGSGDGVGITGKGNIVSSAAGISGSDAIEINGSLNSVSAGDNIIGTWDGVEINGNTNVVDVDGGITGQGGEGVQIDGNNNIVSSTTIESEDDAVQIVGDGNQIDTDTIDSANEDGVDIEGDNNDVHAGLIVGGTNGVVLDGNSNSLSSNAYILGENGTGVDINGNNNDVDALGGITGDGDEGVAITGNSNNVSSNGITGYWDGVDINGNANIVDSGTLGILGSNAEGVDVTGNNNQITSGDTIIGGTDGVSLDGNNNSVAAAGSIGGNDSGLVIDGDGNDVETDGYISGIGDEGADIGGNNNSVTANGISGYWDGLDVNGNSNNVTVGANGIDGDNGDGVDITGTGNVITSAGSVSGGDDGVVIDGSTNSVKVTGDITGTDGDGVDITGNTNIVTATGAISGDPGVIIAGNSNTVSSASISATNDAVNITGSTNTVTTGAIDSTNGDGIEIVSGSGNIITATTVSGGSAGALMGVGNTLHAAGSITGLGGDGVQLDGNSVVDGATSITGSDIGADINGNNNSVSASGTITGQGDEGVDIDGSNNTVNAGGVSGYWDGVDIDGSTNTLTIGGSGVTGQNGDGIDITGTGNVITSAGSVSGDDDGVVIDGSTNSVKVTGDITGTNGDGVDITGNTNIVSATGTISGDPGVIITGNQNNVSATDITGVEGGAIVTGNQNTVSASDDITTTNGYAVGITGNQNVISAGDDITSTNDDGVNIAGNQNSVTANDISGGIDGIHINGNQNFVDAAATVTAVTGHGVWFDSGTGNNVDLTNVTVDAGQDGVHVDEKGNTFQHNASTVINAGDDGIEFEYGGLVNAYESLVWLGTINADDDGIVADSGFFTIINNGTINADVDDNNDGNGISVADNNTVENNGTITGWNGIVGGDKNDVTNDGTITAENDGIQVNDDNTVINNGTINAGDDGIDVGNNNYVENNSVLTINAADNGIEAGDDNEIVNNGVINADTDDNNDGDGIQAGDDNEITNNGEITGWNGIVVYSGNEVTNNGEIDVENNGIIGEDDNTVVNNGDVFAGNNGVELDANNSLTNNIFAIIHGGEDGVVLFGNGNEVSNHWTIHGEDGDGIEVNSSSNTIENDANGLILGGDSGIEIWGSSNTVNNYGVIEGLSNEGIDINSGSGNVITNWNEILGDDDGIEIESDGNTVYNYAWIQGYNGDGIDIESDDNYVYNSGTIVGEDSGVEISGDDNEVDNIGTITGGDDGIWIDGYSNDVYNWGTITGQTDDGVEIDGNSNYVYNNGSITGEDEGIELDGNYNTIYNDDEGSIIGLEGDGIDINSGSNNDIYNEGLIQGYWQGIDNYYGNLYVENDGGMIVGQNSDGIRSNLAGGAYYTDIENYSHDGEDGYNQGVIVGADDGIHAGGEGLYVENGAGSLIEGETGHGIHTYASYNEIYNWGTIIGEEAGIADGDGYYGEDDTYIYNGSTGLISGSEAGYLYEDGSYYYGNVVQIDNVGVIEVTGDGVLPTPEEEAEETAVNLDMINGEDADPVAAIDTSNGGPGLDVFIYNWGQINGANEFSAAVVDDPETEEDETAPSVQLTNRFAILGGEGNEYIANFAGGTINGDIATQAGDDVLAMEIGSTLNGDADLGQTLVTTGQLGLIPDDKDTKDVDESKGGTAVGFVETADVDVGIDTVILFGEGYQDHAGDITEVEILYVNDQITQDDVYSVGPYSYWAAATQPVLENQPMPDGTWSLNGQTKVDGTNVWTFVDVDTDGDGVDDETVGHISGTVATVVDNGRLNIGATTITEILGDPSDEEEGELEPSTYEISTNKTAVLMSPVVDVLSGGTLGGHGTIVTNPGANGGNGGVNLSGAVQGDKTFTVGVNEDYLIDQFVPGEARGSLIVGTTEGDLVTQDKDGKITDATKGDGIFDFKIVPAEDEESDPTTVDLLYTVDDAGKLYPTITLPAGWVAEEFAGPFDFTTDSPRYATLAPGDEITRIGTLTVFGNVTMDGRETGTTNYKIAVLDDPATKDVDESKDAEGEQVYKNQTGRTVVTNWGSQFQADLKDSGEGDLLLVKKTGVTSAFTGSTFDIVGPGPVDLWTQDADGKITDGTKGDGVNDFEVEIDAETKAAVKVDIIVAGKGGADGVPDGIAYTKTTVLDGHASLDGRLDIRLDGEFVDLVDNSQSPTIPDPDGPTGCGDDPDGADSCPQVPNPLYGIPDGIADVDSKGIAKNNADFSKDTKVWDVIVAEGGVSGKFETLGFDGGPNDGAVVVRYDDPDTAENEEVRVQLLKAYLQYLPDRVRIISIPDFGPKGTTINQIATGEYIDSLTQYGLNEDLLHCIIASVGLDGDIPGALDALHPEWYNAFNEVGFSIARGAEQQAYIRTIEAQGFSGGQSNRVVMNVGDDSVVGSSASDKRASFWLAGSWGNADVDDGSNEGWLEYKYETLTGYAGFDYLINPNLLIGILGGFSNTDVDSRNGTKEGDVDSWQVGGYASYFTESWFLNIGGGIGDMNIESIRNIAFGSGTGMQVSQVATADYDGDITYFYGKGGYSFDLGDSGWKLSPELALSYVKVKQDAFSETGVGNFGPILLNVDQQSVESLRGTAQLRLSKTFMSGNGGGWMPYVRAGVANEFEDDLRPITAGFQGAPGTDFTVFGQVPRQTTVIFGAGVTGKVSESFSLYLDYSGELGGSFSEHVISGGARFHF